MKVGTWPGQHDQRDRIHQRVGDAGDGVGGAGARGDQHDAGLAGRAGIALGHVHRALFVAHQDVADVVLLEELVIDRQHGAAGIAEDHLDALILERLNHHLRAGHLLRAGRASTATCRMRKFSGAVFAEDCCGRPGAAFSASAAGGNGLRQRDRGDLLGDRAHRQRMRGAGVLAGSPRSRHSPSR
jgi:hypothetical protein